MYVYMYMYVRVYNTYVIIYRMLKSRTILNNENGLRIIELFFL